jgi:hypothetical protein
LLYFEGVVFVDGILVNGTWVKITNKSEILNFADFDTSGLQQCVDGSHLEFNTSDQTLRCQTGQQKHGIICALPFEPGKNSFKPN